MTNNFHRSRDTPRTGPETRAPTWRLLGAGTPGHGATLCVLGAVASMAVFGCARPNPRFDAGGEPGDSTGGSGGLAGTSTGGRTTNAGTSGSDSSGGSSEATLDGPGFETDGAAATLHVFASDPSNGSLDFDREGKSDQADAHCASIDSARDVPLCGATIRAFVFVEPGSVDQQLSAVLGLPVDLPVDAPNGSRIADSLAAFVSGPHLTTLSDADVVPAATLGVWTGLNPAETGNCQGWTSGNDDRKGGVGELHGDEGWAGSRLSSCGEELPILCLCD